MRIACRDEELWRQLVQGWRRGSVQSGGVFEHIAGLNYGFLFFFFGLDYGTMRKQIPG